VNTNFIFSQIRNYVTGTLNISIFHLREREKEEEADRSKFRVRDYK
jgi:hypothetical protein